MKFTLEDTQRFFDDMADFYIKLWGPNLHFGVFNSDVIETSFDSTNSLFLRLMQPKKVGVFLDLACGAGATSRFLAERGYQKIVGIDISSKQLDIAQRLNKHQAILYRQGDASELPFKNEYFSNCWCIGSFYLFHDKHKVFSEVKRILKHKSKFLFDDMLATENSLTQTEIESVVSTQRFSNLWRAEDYLRELNKERFEVIDVRDLTPFFVATYSLMIKRLFDETDRILQFSSVETYQQILAAFNLKCRLASEGKLAWKVFVASKL